jgi:hypothetical protein
MELEYINTTKTEFVSFHLSQKNDADFEKEEWRQSKLLGSHMCSNYDILQRCIKGNIAFNSYKNVWLQGRRIKICKLVQIYEAMVVSVIMYNCSSWAATKDILDKPPETDPEHQIPNRHIEQKAL